MSIFDRFLPKWKHPDPAIRAKGVSLLDDQELLTTIVDTDDSEQVRVSALKRLTDQAVLARLARENSPLNVHAVEALSDREISIAIAQQADSPRVRERAVEKIDSNTVLLRIAACDVDAGVRHKAKLKCTGADRMHDVIRQSLANLQVAERKAAEVAEFFGTLDDVCDALVKDRRFRINGGLDADEESVPRMGAALSSSSTAATTAASGAVSCATFLAGRRNPEGEGASSDTRTVFYEINIWRGEQDKFQGQVKEKRIELTHDLVAWNRSSHGSGVAAGAKPN